MPLIAIDFRKNSPYTLTQEGQSRSVVGYVFDRIGLKTIRSRLAYGFIVSNGVGLHYTVVVWDKPEMFENLATVRKVVTIDSSRATARNVFRRMNIQGLSSFELHVYEAAQVKFYASLTRRELAQIPNYRLCIENEEDD